MISMSKILNSKKSSGAILLMVVIIMLTVSLLGATLIALFHNILSMNQIDLYRTQALFLAEAGLAQAVQTLRGQAGAVPGGKAGRILGPVVLGEGSFEVYGDFAESTLVSVGSSHGVSRSIQLKYNAF